MEMSDICIDDKYIQCAIENVFSYNDANLLKSIAASNLAIIKLLQSMNYKLSLIEQHTNNR